MTSPKTAPADPVPPGPRTEAMTKGRQADSARRRQRVIAALSKAAVDGTAISVSSIARASAVDRTFLHRHRHRRPLPEDHPPRAAGHRPAAPARTTRRGSHRRPGGQPRTHGPAQHDGTPPVTSHIVVAPHLWHANANPIN